MLPTMTHNLDILDLGLRPYRHVLKMQKDLVVLRRKDEINDTLVLVEHEPVYTLGRNADPSNVIASADELTRLGIETVQIGRGGDVTYHGPGQLVGYPIINLKRLAKGPAWYVEQLERMLVLVLAEYNVHATGDNSNRGVWVKADKIAAIGVRITGGITMHGFALNVSTDLNHYKGIIPCGIRNKGVTSLNILVPDIRMADVKKTTVSKFMDVFNYTV
jgi:lipoyl(octanoyl) transferase